MTAPEHSAGVEAWTLATFVGRRVWARPHGGPDNQPPEWVELRQVWMEDLDQQSAIVGRIDWRGQDVLVRWIVTNRVQVELTAEEAPHIRTRHYGDGYSSTYYDPWDTAELEVIDYRWQLPTPQSTPPEPAQDVVPTEYGDQFILDL